MNPIACVFLLLVILTPIAWFVSEFKSPRWVRLSLGLATFFLSFGLAFLVGSLNTLNYNAWFGSASKELIDETINGLESGKQERVLIALKVLQKKYQPTYENRARYDELVQETIDLMKKQ